MSTQSYVSDELTHFVGRALPNDQQRYSLLREIMRTQWLRASHREQLPVGFTGHSDGEMKLSSNAAIKRPTVCFCDIPLNQLQVHIKKYGPFGIAFAKRSLLHLGATPVHYVACNASYQTLGIGPRTVGDWFDQLRADIQRVSDDLARYVEAYEGRPRFVFTNPPPNASPGHRLLGRLSALQSDLEFGVFGQLKFFTVSLPEDDPENFYMEREWRIPGGLAFDPEKVARVILPREFAERFRAEVGEYSGELTIAEEA